MRFSDLCFNDTTPSELISFLKINYPDEFPLHEYSYIYTLCSGENRPYRRELAKTLFEFYNHNPIDINKDIVLPIIMFLKDEELIIYIIELCTKSNYAPIIFTKDILCQICFSNMYNLLKYIIILPSKYPQYYGNILKDINFNDLIICILLSDETKLTENEFAYYLYKTAIKNKFMIDYTMDDEEYEFNEEENNTPLFHQYGIVCFNDKIKL